jgi:hypothetical protein
VGGRTEEQWQAREVDVIARNAGGHTCCTTAAARGDERELAACSGLTFFALGCSSTSLSESCSAAKSAGKPENADEMATLNGASLVMERKIKSMQIPDCSVAIFVSVADARAGLKQDERGRFVALESRSHERAVAL